MRNVSVGSAVTLGFALLGALSILTLGMMMVSFMANFMGGPQTLEQSMPLLGILLFCPLPLILVIHAGSLTRRKAQMRPFVQFVAWAAILIAGTAAAVMFINSSKTNAVELASITGSFLFPISFATWLLFMRRR